MIANFYFAAFPQEMLLILEDIKHLKELNFQTPSPVTRFLEIFTALFYPSVIHYPGPTFFHSAPFYPACQ